MLRPVTFGNSFKILAETDAEKPGLDDKAKAFATYVTGQGLDVFVYNEGNVGAGERIVFTGPDATIQRVTGRVDNPFNRHVTSSFDAIGDLFDRLEVALARHVERTMYSEEEAILALAFVTEDRTAAPPKNRLKEIEHAFADDEGAQLLIEMWASRIEAEIENLREAPQRIVADMQADGVVDEKTAAKLRPVLEKAIGNYLKDENGKGMNPAFVLSDIYDAVFPDEFFEEVRPVPKDYFHLKSENVDAILATGRLKRVGDDLGLV